MSIQNRCFFSAGSALSFILILLFTDVVNADELAKELQKRSSLQLAEIELIEAQAELENWKHAQLEDLFSKGFASWLEIRRHQLMVDSISARLEMSGDFHRFLGNVERQQQSAAEDKSPVFRQRVSNPIKVFMPGSIRIIGWIEGQSLGSPSKAAANESEFKEAEEKVSQAQQRFDNTTKLKSAPPQWLEKSSLELTLAKKELAYIRALGKLPVQSDASSSPSVISLDEIEDFVTTDQNPRLKNAAEKVAKAEAAATGHISVASAMLEQEKRRASAFERLQARGYASDDEVKIVSDRIVQIQSQLETFQSNQQTLVTAAQALDDANQSDSAATHNSVNDWPSIVLNDKEFAKHLIDLRRNYFQERELAKIAQLKAEMLEEVLARLRTAQTNTKESASSLGASFQEGQLNEIKAYELDIALAKSSIVAANERKQILIHEENRFVQQIVTQLDAAREKLAQSNVQSLNTLGMLSLISPTSAVFSNESSPALRHFSYLEYGKVGHYGHSSHLLYSQRDRRFIGSPYSNCSIGRINLLPIQSSLLISESKRPYSSARGLQVEPVGMDYLRSNLSRNSYIVSGYPLASCFSDRLRDDYYRRYGYRSYGIYYAYAFGVLRSDFRSKARVGQLPWLLPGSPSNFRHHDLHSGLHSHKHRH